MAKLERYIGQLVDDRGGVDDTVLENIVKDIERSSRVKGALKKVRGQRTIVDPLAVHSPSNLQALCYVRSSQLLRW